VLGTRVFNVSVGPVRWSETGPYGNGHYVVASKIPCEPCQQRSKGEGHTCRDAVSPEAVYAAWSYAATDWTFSKKKAIEEHFMHHATGAQGEKQLRSIQVYRSRIRGTDDGGGVVYEEQIKDPIRLEDWTSSVMGYIARSWYCGWVPPIGQGLSRERLSPSLLQSMRQLSEASEILAKVCDEATRTASSLKRKSGELKSVKIMRIRDREEIQDLGMKLADLDRLIERLGRTHAPLQAFGQMSKVLMHNLSGSQLAELGQESINVYKQLGEGVKILRDWIKYTIDLSRPVALVRPLNSPLQVIDQTRE
jgi:hypothetical protein